MCGGSEGGREEEGRREGEREREKERESKRSITHTVTTKTCKQKYTLDVGQSIISHSTASLLIKSDLMFVFSPLSGTAVHIIHT